VLAEAGYALYAVSYDRTAKLEDFAAEHGVTYTLLGDYGSTTIRRLGLLNDRVVEEHGRYGIESRPLHRGVAHPGTFVLDAEGRVVSERFYESYRERDTGPTLARELLGLVLPAQEPPPAPGDHNTGVRVWPDHPGWAWYQHNRIHVALDLAKGWHVYVDPVPDGYVPLSVTVDAPDSVAVHPAAMPAGREHRVDGLDERFVVADDGAEVVVPLTFVTERGSGPVRIVVHVTYQACNDSTCIAPETLSTHLELPESSGVA
jgi:hypothetical protein